jgi:tripartite-type tricarboxylate transporter receptor subunit TctC
VLTDHPGVGKALMGYSEMCHKWRIPVFRLSPSLRLERLRARREDHALAQGYFVNKPHAMPTGREPPRSGWGALFAPKNVPKEIIGKLNAAAVEALADQGVRSRLVDLGIEVYPRERQSPEALNALRKADAEKWWPIIKELGIKPE